MKWITTLFCMISCVYSDALQGQDTISFATVDEQVWIPFITAFNQYDAEGFNALHTEDVLRGGPWGLLIGREYYKRNLKNSEQSKSAGNQRKVSLTFEHRVHREDVCYEVGYYRVISRKSDGTEDTSFGQFHVVLRKQNGIWKIAQDWDASEVKGVALTQSDFEGFAANRVYE